MTPRTARRRVLRVCVPAGPDGQAAADARADLLAVEEPLEIRVGGQPLAVTMRTPGHDIDLAAGLPGHRGRDRLRRRPGPRSRCATGTWPT